MGVKGLREVDIHGVHVSIRKEKQNKNECHRMSPVKDILFAVEQGKHYKGAMNTAVVLGARTCTRTVLEYKI